MVPRRFGITGKRVPQKIGVTRGPDSIGNPLGEKEKGKRKGGKKRVSHAV